MPTPLMSNHDKFRELSDPFHYEAKKAKDAVSIAVDKEKIRAGLSNLRRADLLTSRTQAAVIAADKYGLIVANAIETLDDANIVLTDDILIALINAGEKAEEVANALLFFSSEGLFSLDTAALIQLKVSIETTLRHHPDRKSEIVRLLNMLNDEGVILNDHIIDVIQSNLIDHRSLIMLHRNHIELTANICKWIKQSQDKAQTFVDILIGLKRRSIDLIDEIINSIGECLSKQQEEKSDHVPQTAKDIVEQLSWVYHVGVKLTKDVIFNVLDSKNGIAILLKHAGIPVSFEGKNLVDYLIKNIDDMGRYIIENIIKLKNAGVVFNNHILKYVFIKLSNMYINHYNAPLNEVISAFILLSKEKIELTEAICKVVDKYYFSCNKDRFDASFLHNLVSEFIRIKNAGIQLTDTIIEQCNASEILSERTRSRTRISTLIELHKANYPITDKVVILVFLYCKPSEIIGLFNRLKGSGISIHSDMIDAIINFYFRNPSSAGSRRPRSDLSGALFETCVTKIVNDFNALKELKIILKDPVIIFLITKNKFSPVVTAFNHLKDNGIEISELIVDAITDSRDAEVMAEQIIVLMKRPDKVRDGIVKIACAHNKVLCSSDEKKVSLQKCFEIEKAFSDADFKDHDKTISDQFFSFFMNFSVDIKKMAAQISVLMKQGINITDRTVKLACEHNMKTKDFKMDDFLEQCHEDQNAQTKKLIDQACEEIKRPGSNMFFRLPEAILVNCIASFFQPALPKPQGLLSCSSEEKKPTTNPKGPR